MWIVFCCNLSAFSLFRLNTDLDSGEFLKRTAGTEQQPVDNRANSLSHQSAGWTSRSMLRPKTSSSSVLFSWTVIFSIFCNYPHFASSSSLFVCRSTGLYRIEVVLWINVYSCKAVILSPTGPRIERNLLLTDWSRRFGYECWWHGLRN